MVPASSGSTSGGSGSTLLRIVLPPANGATAAQPKNSTLAGTTAQALSSSPALGAVPAAQSLAININGPTPVSQTVTVGANSSACNAGHAANVCQVALSLAPGAYWGTVMAGSLSGASGTPDAIAFTVMPGASNVVNMTLSGVPAQLVIAPASITATQNAQGGVDLYGAGRHPLVVEMLDANQNVIISPGQPSFTLEQAGGSLPLSITQTATLAPNLFYVTAPAVASASTATVRVNVSYTGANNPCAQSSAVCSGTVRLDVRQILGVANSTGNSVTLYVAGQSAPLATLTGLTNPQALAFDTTGNLFVANGPGNVAEFPAPYNSSPTAISQGVNHPQAVALDAHGDLFVANGNGSNTVTLYAPPYGGTPSATISTGINDPVGLALDAAANLFVVNAATDTVTEYAPPYSGSPVTISKGLSAPNSLAVDGHGNLFVANLNSTPNSVVEYVPPFSNASAPVVTISNGVNEQGAIGLGGSATLFVPNEGANTVTEYVAPYTGLPTTIVGGQSQPIALAIDAAGNLYVANYGNNSVTEYQPPYSSGSWTTISNGISTPLALALSPASNNGAALVP